MSGSLARKTRSAKSRKTEKLTGLETEVARLRGEIEALRNAYNCHTHYVTQPMVATHVWPMPSWRWNGYQYVWG